MARRQRSLPGGLYREYIKRLYQDNELARGTFGFAGRACDLRNLTAPLLVVLAERDHICAPASSDAVLELVGSRDKQRLSYATGHIGLTASRRTLEKLWPRVYAWFD